ncbi:SDR family oxidoreductase [Massilia sp. YIM B04103]|uniref:SDR family oxidoreductase n=1 Tax=Massilia sp. YIM B04103 TaxID=2963106 RepID=UPI00210E9CF2|nr:SDR family NAD(P)-dependent oxidoreductase [Massilia sp. YIM B04103]
MKKRHSSKVILITGACGEVGAAAARLLARDRHRLVLGGSCRRSLERLGEESRGAGGQADLHLLDVTDADDAQSFALAAHRKHGRVDVLVNSHAEMPLSRLDAMKIREWDRMIDVNVRGVLHSIAAVLPLMQVARAGQIVNIGGGLGQQVGAEAAVYCATRSAVAAISEGLRQEVGGEIRVSLVSADGLDDSTGALAHAIRSAIVLPENADAGGSGSGPQTGSG